jgi:hypothetical protein
LVNPKDYRIVAFLMIGKKLKAICMFHVPWHDRHRDRDRIGIGIGNANAFCNVP